MTHFAELLHADLGSSVADQQRRAAEVFPERARELGLVVIEAGCDYQPPMMLLSYVVGVAASWSLPDLRLLDAMTSSERGSALIQRGGIAVFDFGRVKCRSDLERIIPGPCEVYQTPVVGLWKMGGLIAARWGHEARRFLIDDFHLSVDLFGPAPTAAPLA